jgi:hypothetical protein
MTMPPTTTGRPKTCQKKCVNGTNSKHKRGSRHNIIGENQRERCYENEWHNHKNRERRGNKV